MTETSCFSVAFFFLIYEKQLDNCVFRLFWFIRAYLKFFLNLLISRCVKVVILQITMVLAVDQFTVENSRMKISYWNILALEFFRWRIVAQTQMDLSSLFALRKLNGKNNYSFIKNISCEMSFDFQAIQ